MVHERELIHVKDLAQILNYLTSLYLILRVSCGIIGVENRLGLSSVALPSVFFPAGTLLRSPSFLQSTIRRSLNWGFWYTMNDHVIVRVGFVGTALWA
ncbi:hypothetical protein L1887_07603 [Cichorium endivia]|nr:hypothetical protein L1887_07603 [Cichorium endivia]